jgi:hypothetical protein
MVAWYWRHTSGYNGRWDTRGYPNKVANASKAYKFLPLSRRYLFHSPVWRGAFHRKFNVYANWSSVKKGYSWRAVLQLVRRTRIQLCWRCLHSLLVWLPHGTSQRRALAELRAGHGGYEDQFEARGRLPPSDSSQRPCLHLPPPRLVCARHDRQNGEPERLATYMQQVLRCPDHSSPPHAHGRA